MTVHRPSTGVLVPLPDKDNVHEIKTLRLDDCPVIGLLEGSERVPTKTGVSCVSCSVALPVSNGYIGPRGEFYCDDCIWVHAENGEFL